MIKNYTYENGALKENSTFDGCPWIHICPPISQAEIDSISNSFGFPPDFITDSLDVDERSRYEKEDESNFILINTPVLNSEAKVNEAVYITIPLGIVLVDGIIVTITQENNPVITKFLEKRVKGFNLDDPRHFVLKLFEHNVLSFLDCLKKLNIKRNLIEQELYNSSRNEELKQLLRIEKSLVYFVNSLSSNDLLMMKMKRTDFLKIRDDEELTDMFEDSIIDSSQALEMSNVYTNILSGTMEAYASIVSNNLNTFIQRLTIITIILMVPTLVASFYGMNLDYLPMKDNKYAFYLLIFISILLGFILVWFFRRERKSGR